MTRITGKFQITLPKRLVDAFGLKVGDEVALVGAGDRIAIIPPQAVRPLLEPEERVRLFDEATKRQRARERTRRLGPAKSRGWTRDELYSRDRPR